MVGYVTVAPCFFRERFYDLKTGLLSGSKLAGLHLGSRWKFVFAIDFFVCFVSFRLVWFCFVLFLFVCLFDCLFFVRHYSLEGIT